MNSYSDEQDFFKGRTDGFALLNGRLSSSLGFRLCKAFESLQSSNDMLAVTFYGSSEFIQNDFLFLTGGIFIA
jgi:hypothetical protein